MKFEIFLILENLFRKFKSHSNLTRWQVPYSRILHITVNIRLICVSNETCYRLTCWETQNTFVVNKILSKIFSFIIRKNVVKTDRPQNTIKYCAKEMHFVCRITKASDTDWGCVICTAFEWQKWLAKTPEHVVIWTVRVLYSQALINKRTSYFNLHFTKRLTLGTIWSYRNLLWSLSNNSIHTHSRARARMHYTSKNYILSNFHI